MKRFLFTFQVNLIPPFTKASQDRTFETFQHKPTKEVDNGACGEWSQSQLDQNLWYENKDQWKETFLQTLTTLF